MLVRLFDPMTVGIARKHERQGAVARDIARSAEAILPVSYTHLTLPTILLV